MGGGILAESQPGASDSAFPFVFLSIYRRDG
jgi:hypothetical protein